MSLPILIETLKHWKYLNLKSLGAVILTKFRLQIVKLQTKVLPTLTEHCKRQNVRFQVKYVWCFYFLTCNKILNTKRDGGQMALKHVAF